MKTKVSKWGNSMGVRLPKYVIQQLKLTSNSEVEISIEGDTLVLRKRTELDKMLDQVTPESIHPVIFTDEPVGKEIW